MALDDRDRPVGELPNRVESDSFDLCSQGLGADNENRSARVQLGGEQVRRALGAGHDVIGLGGETHRVQMLGHLGRVAGCVVGDVQGAGPHGGEGLDRSGRGFLTAEHGPVEVEKQAIVLLYKCAHVNPAP
jgi:hypothetical protein